MTADTTSLPTPTPAGRWPRNVWLLAGGLALAAVGVAAGLAWRPAPQPELVAPGSLEATRASLAANETVVDGPAASGAKAGNTMPSVQTPPAQTVSKPPAQRSRPPATARTRTAAATCTHCGVVQSVREVREKGQATGVGAVAGGVVGGALGNQVGKGNGRAAMTVIGAIGGGLAGNEIEKRARGETVYEVRVRMDDGSLRTLRQKTAPAPGARVTVQGDTARSTSA